MKRILITFAAFYAMGAYAAQSLPDASWPVQGMESLVINGIDANDDDGWILVGEVTAYWWKNSSEKIKVNLQIREVAHRMVYRIEYNGKYYSIKKLMPNNDNDYRYEFTVNDKTYHFELK